MDSLDSSFGLTLSTGRVGAERAWSDFVSALGLDDAKGADLDLVGSRLKAEGVAAGHIFATLLEELTTPEDAVSVRVSQLVTRLGAAGIKTVIERLEVLERKRSTQSAAATLTPQALIPLIDAVAQLFNQPLSQALLELVQKLAREATTLPDGARAQADQAFRSLMAHLVERWSESQVNAGASGFADMFAAEQQTRSSLEPEPSRIVALSLESGSVGTVVWSSLKELSRTEAGVREIINMVARAPAGRATEMITEQITTPARLTALLREDPIDFDAVDTMVNHLTGNATKPLLDELVEAQNRAVRRSIMDRLVRIGAEIAPLVQERLNDSRWYVVRNMISLLRECGCSIDHVYLDRFAAHDDARVRREMLQLRMEDPVLRDSALISALQDKDKGVLRAALQAARTYFPVGAVGALAKRVVESDFPPEFRVMSLYLLGKSGNVAALDALLAYAGGGKSLLGKAKLANKSPEMLAAVSGLARSWSSERRARELLDVAEKSKDDQILAALKSISTGD